MWLSATWSPGTAQLACWFTRSCRLMISAMASRRTGPIGEAMELSMSSCSMVFDVPTSL